MGQKAVALALALASYAYKLSYPSSIILNYTGLVVFYTSPWAEDRYNFGSTQDLPFRRVRGCSLEISLE